jgi:hypothetical protein
MTDSGVVVRDLGVICSGGRLEPGAPDRAALRMQACRLAPHVHVCVYSSVAMVSISDCSTTARGCSRILPSLRASKIASSSLSRVSLPSL